VSVEEEGEEEEKEEKMPGDTGKRRISCCEQ
jgi:hypothetical protein